MGRMGVADQAESEAWIESPAARFLALDDAALLAQCRVDRYRTRGPGGQKRNKTDSTVRLVHEPTGLSAIGTESRSQHENKARALRRLRKTIALNLRSTVDAEGFQPSGVLRSCVSAARRLGVGPRDGRYCLVVSEILDLLAGCAMHVSAAAQRMGISTANLVSFLEKDAALWERVNQMRRAAGLKPLR